ncbi:MAG: D-alanine--D-alanine ligase family protein [Bryobacteraceae bacterium]
MKTTVAIIYGGRSGEHEISLRSAQSIMEALDPERYKVLQFFISKEGQWRPRPIVPEPNRNPEIDVVFPVLHGTFGEDGTVQGLLELAGLPYVGPGVLASAAAMDKEVAKRLCREAGLAVVDYVIAHGDDCAQIPFAYPVFVKPANLGSSVGITKARDCEELRAALHTASQYDRKVLIERAIVGQEIECSVLGNRDPIAATPCEILPSREFYDYEDKYILDKTEFRIPPDLSAEKIEEVRRIAVAAYQALECEGMARVDFLIEKSTGAIYINEVNTIPGFTSISMYPKMWEHSGLPYPKLLDRLIELAIERHAAKQALKYTR